MQLKKRFVSRRAIEAIRHDLFCCVKLGLVPDNRCFHEVAVVPFEEYEKIHKLLMDIKNDDGSRYNRPSYCYKVLEILK